VGRFSHEKGADRLPALFSSPEAACTLVLAGDGPLREPVLAGLAPLPHLDVQWLGVRRDIGRLLGALDLLVLPSRTEGMPMVVLEAMAAGVPVAAFAVGDVAEAVNDTTGWCVAPDELGTLSQAVTAALRDAAAREARGTAARAHLAAHFSPQRWTAAHLSAYGLAMDAP
jgi:glycosyltransferase involved in cell wall biosynthesis